MDSKMRLYNRFIVPFWKNELNLSPPPIELVAFDPKQTLELIKHPLIKSFQEYITYEFTPKKRYKVALIVPCDAYKPYSFEKTKSKLYALQSILTNRHLKNAFLSTIDKMEVLTSTIHQSSDVALEQVTEILNTNFSAYV